MHWNVDLENKITGKVNRFDEEKGYGFITSDVLDMGDIFIHFSNVEPWRKGHKTLEVGQSVRFNIKNENGKQEAFDLEIHPDDRRSKYAKPQDNDTGIYQTART